MTDEFMERVFSELKREEGCKASVYQCTGGFNTVGIGHNLDASPIDKIIGRKFKANPRLSEDEIYQVFTHDVNLVIDQLNSSLPWWSKMDDARRYVLISLCFNMGINGLLKFKNTLACFRAGNWKGAANGLEKSLWYKQVGLRAGKLCMYTLQGW